MPSELEAAELKADAQWLASMRDPAEYNCTEVTVQAKTVNRARSVASAYLAMLAAPASPSLEACVAEMQAMADASKVIASQSEGEDSEYCIGKANAYLECVNIAKEHWPTAPDAVEPSEATALADWLDEMGAEARIAAMIRQQNAEITGLRKSDELLRKGMESQAELMDGLKQKTREQEAEIEKFKKLLDISEDTTTTLSMAKADSEDELETLRTAHAEMVRRLEELIATCESHLVDDDKACMEMALGGLRSILAESAPSEPPAKEEP